MTQPSSIGRPTPLIDGRAKVLGAAVYTPDLALPGLLHARLVTSLYAHARLRGIDSTAALAVPGVAAVLTAADLPKTIASSRSKLLLARDRVIFAGQPVALVLATSEAAAHDGALQVQVDYEPLPAALTMDEALAPNAPLVWPEGVPDNEGEGGTHGASVDGSDEADAGRPSNLAKEGRYTRGDIAAGFAQAEVIVERTFTTPMVHQSPVETQVVVVQPNPTTGGAEVWASTQSPFGLRKDVAAALDVDEHDVRVRGMTIGGGFGSKNGLYEPLVALAARKLGRPVRLWLTRTEEMLAANPAPPVRIHGRLGARRDGTITALQCEVTVDGGCYPFDLGKFLAYMFGSLYRVPNFDLQGRDVLTFKQSAGAYRAPGAPSVTFALDCLMDEMAHALGLDPLEFRLRHACRPGDVMAKDEDTWPSMGMTAVLEALQAHPAWQNRAQARAQGRGVGIAVGGWLGGTEPAAAVCRLNRDGSLQVHVGSTDLNGTATGFALMAADTFGVAPETVRVLISDTDTAPYSGASAGSKVTYATGSAVVHAAQEARRQVLAIAAEELEAAVEDLEIADGQVQVRGAPDRGLKLKALAEKTYDWGSRHAPVYGAGRFAVKDSAPAFNAQLAEVEVDPDTGVVRVHKLVVVQDVGRAINPLAVQGQMRGGATQGIGWALYEEMLYDEGGQLVTGTLMDYVLPSLSQTAPDIETLQVEVPSEHGPFGARGVGEAPVVPTPAAITNAIADATGLRLTDLPHTAPRVWAALQARA